ncbi:MAG: hypothetical protein ACKOPH_02035 [Methylocystis sp.]
MDRKISLKPSDRNAVSSLTSLIEDKGKKIYSVTDFSVDEMFFLSVTSRMIA